MHYVLEQTESRAWKQKQIFVKMYKNLNIVRRSHKLTSEDDCVGGGLPPEVNEVDGVSHSKWRMTREHNTGALEVLLKVCESSTDVYDRVNDQLAIEFEFYF